MCGIAVIFGEAGPTALHEMLEKLSHRGQDGSGKLTLNRARMGHVRLAIVDIKGGRQPMINESGDTAVVFNGEIYNHLELRDGLSKKHDFKTQSDTEVILHLFEEENVSMLKRLDGMFAFALATPEGLFIARDPMGIKPLYTARLGEARLVASELKAFPEGTDDVKALPAGYGQWVGTQPYPYTCPYTLAKPRAEISIGDAVGGVRSRLEKAVSKRMMADVPVGVFLSGGLDSSLIAGLMKRGCEKLHSFSAGMQGAPDIWAARAVAGHFGMLHHEVVYTEEEAEKALPEIIWALESFDAPLVRSAIPGYFVAKLASEHVKVALSGEGADELFAGYEYLKYVGGGEQLKAELRAITERLQDTNLQRTDRMTMAHGVEGRVPFLDNELVRFVTSLPAKYLLPGGGRPEKWLLREAFQDLLPKLVLRRKKMKFSEGAGSSELMAHKARERFSTLEFERRRNICPGISLRSREELLYYDIWRGLFGAHITPEMVGRTKDPAAAAEVEDWKPSA